MAATGGLWLTVGGGALIAAVMLVRSPVARAIVRESFAHPTRRSVIVRDQQTGAVHVERESRGPAPRRDTRR
jgi:hypothetical protein